jgi:two-component system response regulator FixJ
MVNDQVVHVIDDDAAVRESLAFLLGTSGFTAHTYETADAFLHALPDIEAGCVITDVRMPGLTGIELLERLNESAARLPVIVVTGHGDVALAVAAMKLGAADFLEKPFDDERLLAAVRGACERMRETGAEANRRAEVEEKLAMLSNRERQVLDGLVAGHPNKTIAYDLGISPRTVEVYRANLMMKMRAHSLSELVRMALIAGTLGGAGKEGSTPD